MRKKRNIIYSFAVLVLLVACNETLEDTYSDFSGDGKIRYVAKCTEFHSSPGWERLTLDWQNGTDATIDKIKLVWSFDGVMDSVLLPNTSTSYELKNLVDGTYRFDLCAVDKAGNESLREFTYGRPYTRDHEVMRAFTRGVVKSYFLDKKMVFFSDVWSDGIVEMKLKYKDTDGNTQYYVFDKDKSYNTLITLPGVSENPADTVYMLRKGRLEGCTDVVEFDPLVINRKKNFSTNFVNTIQRRYGYSTDTQEQEAKFNEFIENVEELEFDYDMETFEDILYCSNLKKLIFGKNRYLKNNNNSPQGKSVLRSNEAKSILVLNKANELLKMTIDYYGSKNPPYMHYLTKILPYMTYKGYSALPSDIKVIGKEELKEYSNGSRVNCSPQDLYAELDNLLDDNFATTWETTSFPTVREYLLAMELNEETEIRGVKVSQVALNAQTQHFMPSMISIQTSVDGVNWERITYFTDNELGRSSNEITLLPIAEGSRRVRFIKFSVRDGIDLGGNCMCKLGDVVLYK